MGLLSHNRPEPSRADIGALIFCPIGVGHFDCVTFEGRLTRTTLCDARSGLVKAKVLSPEADDLQKKVARHLRDNEWAMAAGLVQSSL